MRGAVIVVLTALATGCYAPSLAPCTVRCSAGDACPDEMVCGADRYCHPSGDTSTCSPDYFLVSVRSAGTGTGTVAGGNIDCGPLCDVTVRPHTTLKLTATADRGSRFTDWSGACSGNAPGGCAIAVDGDVVVGARFTLAAPLNVSFPGGAAGNVVSNPAGIDCSDDCTGLFDLDATVTLTATPTPPADFVGWGGACDGTGPCVVTLTDSTDVSADFE